MNNELLSNVPIAFPKIADSGTSERNRHLFYSRALFLCVVFQVLHMIALPIMITWDGCLYIALSKTLFHENFVKEWDFLRVPLFPLSIKVFFGLFGEHPMSIIFLNSLFGFLGIWMLGSAVEREGYPKASAAAILLMSVYPILVTYQHTLLSDVGIFCCLSALINVTLWRPRRMWHKTAALVFIVTVSYYFRPNLLYMGPVMAVLSLLFMSQSAGGAGWRSLIGKISRPMLLHAMLAASLPFVLSMPWQYLASMQDPAALKNRMNDQFIVGLFNQMIVHPGDPLVGPELSPKFQELINNSLVDGHLALDGIGGSILDTAMKRRDYFSENTSFLRVISTHPLRYAKGALRTTLLFCGIQGHYWQENRPFMQWVMPKEANTDAIIGNCPPWLEATVRAHFSQKTGTSILGQRLMALEPIFDILVILGSAIAIVGLFVGLKRADLRLMTFTLMPAAFIGMHVLALLSYERYAFPTFTVALVNLIVCPILIFDGLNGNRKLLDKLDPARREGAHAQQQ